MGFKDYFLINDNKEQKKEAPKKADFSFPEIVIGNDVSGLFPVNPIKPDATLSCEPYMDKVLKVYDEGFKGLNKEGYDFFEFYETITEVGITPETVKLGFVMAKNQHGITKEQLLSQAEAYITEINGVHANYKAKGEQMQRQFIQETENKKTTAQQQLNDIERQIEALKTKQFSIRAELQNLNNNNSTELQELQCKAQANDVARDKIISSIKQVVEVIKTNIQ